MLISYNKFDISKVYVSHTYFYLLEVKRNLYLGYINKTNILHKIIRVPRPYDESINSFLGYPHWSYHFPEVLCCALVSFP